MLLPFLFMTVRQWNANNKNYIQSSEVWNRSSCFALVFYCPSVLTCMSHSSWKSRSMKYKYLSKLVWIKHLIGKLNVGGRLALRTQLKNFVIVCMFWNKLFVLIVDKCAYQRNYLFVIDATFWCGIWKFWYKGMKDDMTVYYLKHLSLALLLLCFS